MTTYVKVRRLFSKLPVHSKFIHFIEFSVILGPMKFIDSGGSVRPFLQASLLGEALLSPQTLHNFGDRF